MLKSGFKPMLRLT